MTNSASASLLLAALILPAAPAAARPAASAIRVENAWVRATPPHAPSAAAYLSIINGGAGRDRLLSAASPRAETVELHSMSMAGGVMRMRPVTAGVEVAAGRTVVLGPGAVHLMLVRPRGALKAGDAVPVTLRFEKAGAVSATFPVKTAP